MKRQTNLLQLNIETAADGFNLRCPNWPAFQLNRLQPQFRINNRDWQASTAKMDEAAGTIQFFGDPAELTLKLQTAGDFICLQSTLKNTGKSDFILNHVQLLNALQLSFGEDPKEIRVFEQGNYWGRVRALLERPSVDSTAATEEITSDLVWLVYDRPAKMAFLAGFETSERWLGRVKLTIVPDQSVSAWAIEFDGGDLVIQPGQEIHLEDVLLTAGPNPWRLLEQFADRVAHRHPVTFPKKPPVSWCSWYPYRLGVTENRLLENAQVAAQRLKPLGMQIFEVDLGWEKEYLPSMFEENDQFPHGLKWLSEKLKELGFIFGVWKAPFTISEFDPLVQEHPEWLICDETGQPVKYWEWFWKPHGKVFILDLSQPGARDWLWAKMESLRERGVGYLKADFIGCVAHPLAKQRHDKTVVAGGGTEAARLGAYIIRQSLPDALLLNCGGPDLPGTGHWPLFYTCNDTGNSGFLSQDFQQKNYLALACHLFKNQRWGILQPSCLVVGLPGTVEEARLRATLAFLSGGQIDISDTLTTLPEDRWEILTATLPPLGISATPVDLFEPAFRWKNYDYSGTCKSETDLQQALEEVPPGSVWQLHIVSDWDEWDLAGIFCYDSFEPKTNPAIRHFLIPLTRFGFAADAKKWGYEFWSHQALGVVPGRRTNPRDYRHPGDFQDLASGDTPGMLELAFFGPGAKLLCLRDPKPHPWILGTTFHQSCGTELKHVRWNPKKAILSGEIQRPVGEQGLLIIATTGKPVKSQKIAGKAVPGHAGANASWVVPVTVTEPEMSWEVVFED